MKANCKILEIGINLDLTVPGTHSVELIRWKGQGLLTYVIHHCWVTKDEVPLEIVYLPSDEKPQTYTTDYIQVLINTRSEGVAIQNAVSYWASLFDKETK